MQGANPCSDHTAIQRESFRKEIKDMARRRENPNPRQAAIGGVIARYGSNLRNNRSMPMTRALNATINAQARGGTGAAFSAAGSGGTGG